MSSREWISISNLTWILDQYQNTLVPGIVLLFKLLPFLCFPLFSPIILLQQSHSVAWDEVLLLTLHHSTDTPFDVYSQSSALCKTQQWPFSSYFQEDTSVSSVGTHTDPKVSFPPTLITQTLTFTRKCLVRKKTPWCLSIYCPPVQYFITRCL